MLATTLHAVLGTNFEPPFPAGYERAVFGMGCFWGADRLFWFASQDGPRSPRKRN